MTSESLGIEIARLLIQSRKLMSYFIEQMQMSVHEDVRRMYWNNAAEERRRQLRLLREWEKDV